MIRETVPGDNYLRVDPLFAFQVKKLRIVALHLLCTSTIWPLVRAFWERLSSVLKVYRFLMMSPATSNSTQTVEWTSNDQQSREARKGTAISESKSPLGG
jgi:hypothetical protein